MPERNKTDVSTQNEGNKITELKIERLILKRSSVCALSLGHCFLTKKSPWLVLAWINIGRININ